MLATLLALAAQGPCDPHFVLPTTQDPLSGIFATTGDRLLAASRDDDVLWAYERDAATGHWVATQAVDLGHVQGYSPIRAVAIDGNLAVLQLGTLNEALVFLAHDESTGTWNREQIEIDLGFQLQGDLAIVGGTVLVAGWAFGTGPAVRVFERAPGSSPWSRSIDLQHAGAAPSSNFGQAIAFDGRVAVLGDPDALEGRGAAHVFVKDSSGGWSQTQTLYAPEERDRAFGEQVAIDRDYLMVSSPSNIDDGSVLADRGSLTLFRFVPSLSVFVPVQTLVPPGLPAGLRFGQAMRLEQGYVVAGARAIEAQRIRLFSFRRNDATGLFRFEREITQGQPPFASGDVVSFALAGPLLHVGFADGAGSIGVAPVGTIDCDSDMAVDSCEILLGQEYDLNRNGLPDACEQVATRYCAPATTSSTGSPVRIDFFGPPRTALLHVDLVAAGLPVGAFGFFLAARTNQVMSQPALWNGAYCLAGSDPSRRVGGAQFAGADGRVQVLYNRSLLPGPQGGPVIPIQPGDTWYFQYWYRDQGQQVESSYSDAIEVTFTLF